MLKIVHFNSEEEHNTETYYSRILQESYLVSYKEVDKIVITKSRWFIGEYPHKRQKDGSGNYYNFVVDLEVYKKIMQDTINKYFKEYNIQKSFVYNEWESTK